MVAIFACGDDFFRNIEAKAHLHAVIQWRIRMRKNIRFLCWFPVMLLAACSTEANLQQIIGTAAFAPVFEDCRPLSSTEMVFNFSTDVSVVSLNFEPALEVKSIYSGSEVRVNFAQPLAEGIRVTAYILVEDSRRNTLNVIVPFRTRNDRIPALVINELRTEFSRPRVEFVEMIAREAGNLGALRLFIASYSLTKPVYEFPPAEVAAGEYIVLHLRTLNEESVDETGSNLALSPGNEAQDTARDFWLPGNTKRLRRTDAVWLMDQDDRIIDAVLLSERADTRWANENMAQAAAFLARNNAWLGRDGTTGGEGWIPSPLDAVITSGTTATRTICRDESVPPRRQAGNWYITATSGASPGRPNDPRRHL